MGTNDKRQPLIIVLREAREFLARPGNDFAWSSWENAADAIREVDSLILRLENSELPARSDIDLLFLATGPIQEVSLSSGWGREFLALAARADVAVQKLYGRDPRELAKRRAELAGQMNQMVGGNSRWVWTVLCLFSISFAVYLWLAHETPSVYFPLHLEGNEAWWALIIASGVFSALGAVNWYFWLRQSRRK